MATTELPVIDMDWSAFHPWRVQPVWHRLSAHPLLQFDQLIELGKRLEAVRQVRTHSDQATAATPFNEAPRLHPNGKSTEETLRRLNDAKAWMSLLNVQTDPVYRTLVDTVLDSIEPRIHAKDPGMCYRGGWIFVSSPHAITPFHFDKEHNFILQMRGSKRMYVWDPDDVVVASERAWDRFHHTHARDMLQWHEEFRARARVFDLRPGDGAYMPSTSPHMVENGDQASVTMSFTYYTHATRRDSTLRAVHERLHRLGIEPAPVGRHPRIDDATHAAARLVIHTRQLIRRLVKRSVVRDDVAYAPPLRG